MNKLRELLQSKFEEIQGLDSSPEKPDDVLEQGKTYFTYTLRRRYVNSDFDKNFTYRVNIIGYIKRLQNDEENTLEIVDSMSDKLKEKMKELNIKASFDDVSIMDGIRKILVTAEVEYNEINNALR